MAAKLEKAEPTSEAILGSFIVRFPAPHQKLFRSVRAELRKRFASCNELAYDYTTSIVISYTPDQHGIHGIASISLRDDGVRLYLNQAAKLSDPKKLLTGSGKQARYLELESANDLKKPDVAALIAAAMAAASVPIPSEGKGELVIRTGGPKPAGRRKSAK